MVAAPPLSASSHSSPSERPVRLVHLVANLKEGGAEALVRALCPRLARLGADVRIISVYGSNLSDDERQALGVPVIEIGRAGRRDISFFPRLLRRLRELRPDIVHAHISTGKYVGRLSALLA